MVISHVLSLGLLFGATPESTPSNPRAEYEAVRSGFGRDGESQVKLALWCEAHGLSAERMKHLAIAVLVDPRNARARGLMGLMNFGGRWQRPDLVTERVEADEALTAKLAEYQQRRARAANSADAQWKLGLWCEESGLNAEALAHFTRVVHVDPNREAAWKRLGCKKHGGRWVSETQLQAEKAEAAAQKQADKHWRPLLARWRDALNDKNRHIEADTALSQVTDPRAVPAIWAVFATRSPALQARAVQLFGQIDDPAASRALAFLSVFSASPEVRRTATETLRLRDPRDFVANLIGLFRDPVKYEVRPVGGPGSQGALFVSGKKFNVQRLYSPPPMPNIPLYAGENVTFDEYGLPVVSRWLGPATDVTVRETATVEGLRPFLWLGGKVRDRKTKATTVTETTTVPVDRELQIPIGQIALQYQTAALAAQEQLRNDVNQIEAFNTTVREGNEAASQVLQAVTGADLGQDRVSWSTWWINELGYAASPQPYEPVPTIVQDVPLDFQPQGVFAPVSTQFGTPTTTVTTSTSITPNHNCFQAGTLVRTRAGLRPIETVAVGDQILTQDTKSAALNFQPVVAIFHNRPAPTLAIDLGGETIVATPIHRFWKVGAGWTMSRDLKPGDTLRVIGGSAQVISVNEDRRQPVFNLQVADSASFFVGKTGLLVHDNSLVQPTIDPFDAVPTLAALAPQTR